MRSGPPPPPSPVAKPALGKRDGLRRRLLGCLPERLQGQKDLATAPLGCEKEAVDDPVAVRTDLLDVALNVASGPKSLKSDLPHRCGNGGGVNVGEASDELADGAAASRWSDTPASDDGAPQPWPGTLAAGSVDGPHISDASCLDKIPCEVLDGGDGDEAPASDGNAGEEPALQQGIERAAADTERPSGLRDR